MYKRQPLYTSLAGGGFLLATGPGLGSILFDFFVSVPGLGRTRPVEAPVPVPIRFGAATQTLSVSYTHLDVYKRQGLSDQARVPKVRRGLRAEGDRL